jgi:hypothetical protein
MNDVVNSVLVPLVLTLLSVVLSGFIPYAFALAKNEIAKFLASKPNVANEIQALSPLVVSAVEQLRKLGVIPSGEEAKKYAVTLMETWLRGKGITVDLEPFADMISSAIEAEVNKLPPFVANPTPIAAG